ncbi:hypothetical protein O3P69_003387 [Scylla paramamosain]|uniref:Mutator-like transposase domain-containing protein n=1 Tax=Scylla paramamosain TaxID=85552 RepID=A0AAW0ULX9_SCYPA
MEFAGCITSPHATPLPSCSPRGPSPEKTSAEKRKKFAHIESAVIDANTGHVLDYETMSKYCELCSYKKKTLSKEKYEEWYAGHVSECHINYEGSSGGMEAAAAVILWGRSLSHNMRYTTFISDGDSSAFLAVNKMHNNVGPYGKDHPVTKEE